MVLIIPIGGCEWCRRPEVVFRSGKSIDGNSLIGDFFLQIGPIIIIHFLGRSLYQSR